MFYIKSRGRKINLRNDNVFTRCPVCGREHAVDIVETFRGGFADLYGTSVYCPECAENLIRVTREEKQESRPGGRQSSGGVYRW